MFFSDRKKRKKSATTEEGLDTPPADAQNEVQPQQNGSSHQHMLLLEKSPAENGKPSDANAELDSSSNSDIDERKKDVETSTPRKKRYFHCNFIYEVIYTSVGSYSVLVYFVDPVKYKRIANTVGFHLNLVRLMELKRSLAYDGFLQLLM